MKLENNICGHDCYYYSPTMVENLGRCYWTAHIKNYQTLCQMSSFNIWYDEAPPKETWVWASYSLNPLEWVAVKTCRRGCCVYWNGYSMVLPTYWKEMNKEDALYHEKKKDSLSTISIDIDDYL